MDPTRLLRMDGVLTNLTGEMTVTDDHVPVPETVDLDVKCWIELERSEEDTVGGDQQTERWKLYLAPVECSGSSKLAVAGMDFEFAGPPWPATNPRTLQVTHVEAKGVRVR